MPGVLGGALNIDYIFTVTYLAVRSPVHLHLDRDSLAPPLIYIHSGIYIERDRERETEG